MCPILPYTATKYLRRVASALLTAVGSRVATPLQATLHAAGVDQQKAKAFVDSLTNFDRRMNQVVVGSGILKGIPEGRLRSAGEPVSSQLLLVCTAASRVYNRFLYVHHRSFLRAD